MCEYTPPLCTRGIVELWISEILSSAHAMVFCTLRVICSFSGVSLHKAWMCNKKRTTDEIVTSFYSDNRSNKSLNPFQHVSNWSRSFAWFFWICNLSYFLSPVKKKFKVLNCLWIRSYIFYFEPHLLTALLTSCFSSIFRSCNTFMNLVMYG